MSLCLRGPCAATSLLLSACSYHPGSFRDWTGTWPQTHTTTACLDVALARRDRSDTADSVIAYRIGNRCDQPVVVDLASVRAVGRDAQGNERALVAFDPRHELRPLALNALWSGKAEIAYDGGGAMLESVCLDLSRIEPDRVGDGRWMCLAKEAP
jgi:hypothetical protein